jgi:tetratricopeptide (TPR) repeat protein
VGNRVGKGRNKTQTRGLRWTPGHTGIRRHSTLLWSVGLALALSLIAAVVWYEHRPRTVETQQQSAQASEAVHYVGSSACVPCHRDQAERWRTSQHHDAMAEASDRTVLGNFHDATLTYAGTTSTFRKRDGRFSVQTDGRDGRLADFNIKYTFGVYPLQQYLVEFPDGRVQALSITWDARPKAAGGQRWFHLYPTERITHDDELHWTRPAQNWNFMCADCHSTGVRKNYDASADRFKTSWAEINVSCEACHGPGSRHVHWAQTTRSGQPRESDDLGLTVRLDERHDAMWTVDATSGNATRSKPRTTQREIEVCAQCHSRRAQIAEGHQPGTPLLDHYFPALLTSPLYYADGQQQGEVYNWGSFLQSRMHDKGVTCSDCHEPHGGKLRLEGNALCSSCHLATKYDTAAHHHHTVGSTGAACISCHMPATTYMVVDPRHDHSLRVPRPDLSVTLGTPNACNGCHAKQDARWAAERVRSWFGHDPDGYQRFGPVLSAAHVEHRDRQAELRALAADVTQPAIARASALAQIDASSNPVAFDTLAQGLRDPNGIVRFGAMQAVESAPMNIRAQLAGPRLSDPLRAVRIEAVSVLKSLPTDQLTGDARRAFDRAAGEYVETQRYNSDRAEARVNLGTFYGTRGDASRGEEELKSAIRLDPFFIPSYVNLADLYRAFERDPEGERTLRGGIAIAPGSGVLHYALGLALVRMKRINEALPELERASVLDPGDARFAYAYGVALHSVGNTAAAKATLEKALAAHPDDVNVRAALASFTKSDQR